MTAREFTALRKRLSLTQRELAEHLDMSLRAIQEIEKGEGEIRQIHALAIERIAMTLAVAYDDPMLAPGSVRNEALEISRRLRGVE